MKIGRKKLDDADRPFPNEGYVTDLHAARFIGTTQKSIWVWSKMGKFPAPIKVSANITRWRAEEVRAYLDERSSARIGA